LKKHLDNIIMHRLPAWKNLIKSKPQQVCPMQSKLVVKNHTVHMAHRMV